MTPSGVKRTDSSLLDMPSADSSEATALENPAAAERLDEESRSPSARAAAESLRTSAARRASSSS